MIEKIREKTGNLSKRTLALFAAALLLLCVGGVTGVKAALNVTGSPYDANLELSQGMNITILEGTGEGQTDVGESGELLSKFKDKDSGKQIAAINPGKKYEETIAVKSNTGFPEYVRLVVRKYWLDENGKKARKLDPDLIKLRYDSSEYNSSTWLKNDAESTKETAVYYYKNVLSGTEPSEPLFNNVSIDGSILKLVETKKTPNNGKTVITYIYKYDGYTFGIEADAQAVQTHNAKEAIKSVWGVDATLNGSAIESIK